MNDEQRLPRSMTPSELDALSQALLPGQSKNKRYAHLGKQVGYSLRSVYDWGAGKKAVPEFVETRLRAEEQRLQKRSAKKSPTTAKMH